MLGTMSANCRSDVIAFVAELKPGRVLYVAPEGTLRTDALGTGPEVAHLTPEAVLAAAAPDARYELAYVAGVLEAFDTRRGAVVLARLRDLYARRVLVCLRLASSPEGGWTENDLLAYGFTRLRRYRDKDGDAGLYAFDLDTYKVTPDWFGPHDWANPERWDQDWW